MRILLLGTPVSSANRGVLALGASLVGLFRQTDPEAEISLLIGHHRQELIPFRAGTAIVQVPVVPCRLSLRSNVRDHLFWIVIVAIIYRLTPSQGWRSRFAKLSPWVHSLHHADFVGDIRGGDSFSDIYGFSRFLYGFTQAAVVLLVKGNLVQLPQTYGPYKGKLATAMARFLLNRSGAIYARDRASRQVALDLINDRREVALCPDVAFSLGSIPPRVIRLNPNLAGAAPNGLIGVNVNGLMYNGGYTRNNMFGLKLDYATFLPALVTNLLERSPSEIWLIPHTLGKPGSLQSDSEASAQVRAALPLHLQARVRLVEGEYDQHEFKSIIGQTDFFVGSRMHACIAALSQGVPCVGVAYSMKFSGVFESVGMKDWIIDGRETNVGDAIAGVVRLFEKRDSVRAGLSLQASAARSQLKEVFKSLLFRSKRSVPDIMSVL